MLIKFYHDTGGDNWTHNDNWCSDKPIDEWYGVTYNGKTLYIYLYSNNLTGAGDLSGCTALKRLACYKNQLSSLNVSDCTALEKLYCYENHLTSLNVSGCTALEWLWCNNNQLTSLNVSGCTALKWLDCKNNPITQQITAELERLEKFYYDQRYAYSYFDRYWHYNYSDHHGWYYPNEPYSGYTYDGWDGTDN